MRVVIVAERRLYADVLAAALGLEGPQLDIDAVTSLDDAVEACRREPADVVLIDQALSDAPGTVLRRLNALVANETRFLLLSADDWADARRDARAAGLDGAVSKFALPDELARIVSSGTGERIVHAAPYRPESTARRHRCASDHRLTPREYDVMRELARGGDNATIATRLGIRPNTARTHVQNILAKLNVSTRLEVATHALEHDLASTSTRPTDEVAG